MSSVSDQQRKAIDVMRGAVQRACLPTTCAAACDQCQVCTINGHSVHEAGCPNGWINPATQEGYPAPCWECGCDFTPTERPHRYSVCPSCQEGGAA